MIPTDYQDLLTGKELAHVATQNPDGSIQISPVWIDIDENKGYPLINTAKGRKKDRNMIIGSPVAISIAQDGNFYRYITIQGRVAERTEEGALEHINQLSKRYFNRYPYNLPEGEIRIKIAIEPLHVKTAG
ncbi:MAG: pyridoxamine 5'-phosphate oxidase family protein [Candidatus Kariarchaeaceae archaeon]|jgi:PPOX class probable F420-dependent enzyme